MPKAKKRSSTSKIKDFDKQKTKLGKGKKPAASNATNTSFKARSIALTQQSIVKDRSAAPTSKRNLTSEELIGQTRHYSASVRRDALNGLKEIYQSHKELAFRHLGRILPNISRLVADDDAGVRASLHSFLSFYLVAVPAWSLQPYASTLLLYTTSAMSHIYPDVRQDAVRILDLLYPVLGSQVSSAWEDVFSSTSTNVSAGASEASQGHGERVLRCYLSLLGVALQTDTSSDTARSSQVVSSDLSSGARLLILRSMHQFFQQTDSNENKVKDDLKCPTWFWDSYFTSLPELAAFKSSLDCQSDDTSPDNLFRVDESCIAMADLQATLGNSWSSSQILLTMESISCLSTEVDSSRTTISNDRGSSQRQFFRLISPLLISVFLDAAPTAFSPSEQSSLTGSLSTSAHLVCIIASLTLDLWRGTTCSDLQSRDCLSKLLTHMAAYFPFGNEWQEQARVNLISLNLSYCELVGLLAVTENKKRKKQEANTAMQMSHVSDFVIQLLHEEGRSDRIRQPILRGQTFADLLPTIWLLLNGKESQDCKLIMDAVFIHWNSLKAHDPTKRIGAEFIGRLWLLPLQRSYRGAFTIRLVSPHRSSLVMWLTQSVPRYLWELHGKDNATTAILLELLRIVACQTDGLIIKDKPNLPHQELEALGRPLTPFFQIRHATKGPIPGPYTRLPSSLQKTAKGLLKMLPSLDAGLQEAAFAVGAWVS